VPNRVGADSIAAIERPLRSTSTSVDRPRRLPPQLSSAPTRFSLTRASEKLFLGFLPPALLIVLVAARYLVGRHLGFDYRPLWEASHHVFNGVSPYPAVHAAALHNEQQFVYPPVAAVLAAPLAVFPFGVAAALFAAVEIAATVLTLRLLGVRDWRCYGVSFLWYPVLQNFLLGSITSLLALGLAVAWRYRDDRRISIFVSAALIAAKVFLWPLLFWFAATRRWGTAIRALGLALAAVALSWALVGFGGLTSYPRLLDELSRLESWKSYSAVALGLVLGLSTGEARALAIVAGVAVIAAMLVIGYVRRGEAAAESDRQVFVLAIAAAFLFSPIVWTHYLALLVVPIAITRRTLTPLWFVPLAMWATTGQSNGQAWQVVVGLAVWSVVLGAALRTPRRLPAARTRVTQPVVSLGVFGR
jgi:alpha-1,2-mannosyltransferase